MPKAPADLWAVARLEWETTNVSYSDIARKLGTSVPTVTLRAKREMWTRADIERVNFTPQQLVDIGIQALVRAATQTDDTASAVKAALALLDRTLGKVAAEQTTPMVLPETKEPGEEWPEWFSARRLAYQDDRLAEELPNGIAKTSSP